MAIPAGVQQGFEAAAEALFAAIPRSSASAQALRETCVIAHRGERADPNVAENSFEAFDPLVNSNVWGIEFDVRWTRDLQPVVVHDADLQRVFGQSDAIAALSLAELRRRQPAIPSLEEMLARYAARFHLMIELKDEHYPDPAGQQQTLAGLLAGLEPARDFHILSLETPLFEHAAFAGPQAWLPVARTNVAQMSAFAMDRGCAGLAGQFALLGQRWVRRHVQRNQVLGVGFPAHRNVLLREINRGVRWIFSNHALRVQALLDHERERAA